MNWRAKANDRSWPIHASQVSIRYLTLALRALRTTAFIRLDPLPPAHSFAASIPSGRSGVLQRAWNTCCALVSKTRQVPVGQQPRTQLRGCAHSRRALIALLAGYATCGGVTGA